MASQHKQSNKHEAEAILDLKSVLDGNTAPSSLRAGRALFGSGTPNQIGLRALARYLEMVLEVPGYSKELGESALDRYLACQERMMYSMNERGHEACSPSHRQYWHTIFFGFLVAAIEEGTTHAKMRALRIARGELALCHLCAIPADDISWFFPRANLQGPNNLIDYVILSPGARGATAKNDNLWRNPAADLTYSVARGSYIPKPKSRLWQDRYNLGPSFLRYIFDRHRSIFNRLVAAGTTSLLPGPSLPTGPWPASDLPNLGDTLTVYRSGPNLVAYFSSMVNVMEPQFLTSFVDGKVTIIGYHDVPGTHRWKGGQLPEDVIDYHLIGYLDSRLKRGNRDISYRVTVGRDGGRLEEI